MPQNKPETSLKRHPLAFLAVLILLAGAAHARSKQPKQPKQPSRSSQQLLIASDLHFNPFADPALVPELASAPARKWEAILNRSSSTAYSPYGQDTNCSCDPPSTRCARQTPIPH